MYVSLAPEKKNTDSIQNNTWYLATLVRVTYFHYLEWHTFLRYFSGPGLELNYYFVLECLTTQHRARGSAIYLNSAGGGGKLSSEKEGEGDEAVSACGGGG